MIRRLQIHVRFIDYDDTVLYVQKVASGEDAIAPQSPTRSGYTFYRMETCHYRNHQGYGYLCPVCYYRKPGRSERHSNTWAPGTTATPAPGTNTTTKLYTLTVKNGSGSGSLLLVPSRSSLQMIRPRACSSATGRSIHPIPL